MIRLHVKLGFPLATTPQRSKNQWKEALLLNAQRINEKRVLAVPDEGKFAERIADFSSARYPDVISGITPDPRTGLTSKMIYDNQRSNLSRSYLKWTTKLDRMFETVNGVVAKRFKDVVEAAETLFGDGVAARTLRAVGSKIEGVGAAVIAPFWLTDHPKAESLIRKGTDKVIDGAPYNITPAGYQNAFVAMLTHTLTMSMIQALKSNMDATVVADLNTRLNHLCQRMVDPGLGLTPFATGGLSHCDIVDDPALGEVLDVQVDQI